MNRQDERLWGRCHADGVRLFHEGRDAEAERKLREAVRHAEAAGIADARLASTLYQLAVLAQADHRWTDADEHYRRALALAPMLPDTQVSLALLYERLGLPRKALGCWRRYLQLSPNGAWAEIARGRL